MDFPEGPCYTCAPLEGPFARWCEEVAHLVASYGRAIGRLPGEPAIQYVYRCRCDEPYDAFRYGMTAPLYAADVMTAGRRGGTGHLDPREGVPR